MSIKSILVLLLFSINSFSFAQTLSETKTEHYFESIKSNPKKLFQFLYAMPKGADLHTHKNGTALAENMLRYAKQDNLCVNRQTYSVFADAACAPQDRLNTAIKNIDFHNAIIDAWSMRHFTPGRESGHDHFFGTFLKFYNISIDHGPEILSEMLQRAESQNEIYLEVMVTPDINKLGLSKSMLLGKKFGYDSDFKKMHARLLANGMSNIIASISRNLDDEENKAKKLLHCDTKQPGVGCQIKLRYLYQGLRELPPEMVFAQLVAGFEAASKDPRIVGLNIVQPEDGLISMRDYKLHMRMIGFLKNIYKDVRVSLHAGELTKAIVPIKGLTFHISDAVKVAHADRIGHGVDISNEDNREQLLKEMAAKQVMVEINLISNAHILGIKGKHHPLPLYMHYGVPVSLSTDDEGVTRSVLTNEYQQAVLTYQFSYPTIKMFARNSIAYAFLPGKTLWQDGGKYHVVNSACAKDVLGATHISTPCKMFLDANEKASMQWELEKRFNQFENRY